jgi:hypothetical protein
MNIINKNFRLRFLEVFISFCIGISWGMSVLFSITAFQYGMHFGIFNAFVLSVMALVVGFIFVALFEIFSLLLDGYKEKQKQSKILSDILDKLINDKISDN